MESAVLTEYFSRPGFRFGRKKHLCFTKLVKMSLGFSKGAEPQRQAKRIHDNCPKQNKPKIPPSIAVCFHVSVFVYLGFLVLMEMFEALQQSTVALKKIRSCQDEDVFLALTVAILFRCGLPITCHVLQSSYVADTQLVFLSVCRY